jgi:hypothetical protein
VQTLATKKRTRTMTINPRTHRIYLATAYSLTTAAETQVASPAGSPPREPLDPATFRVLVYGPTKQSPL